MNQRSNREPRRDSNRPHSGVPSVNDTKKRDRTRRPRLIAIDENVVSDSDGHFEFASLMLAGAKKFGYRPALASHIDFSLKHSTKLPAPVARSFAVKDMMRWSLGSDGLSKSRRDLQGQPCGGSSLQNTWQRMSEKLAAKSERPENMLAQWSSDMAHLLTTVQPKKGDSLLLNLSNDFTLLALAAANQHLQLKTPLRIDVVFRSAFTRPGQDDSESRGIQFAQQVNHCLQHLKPHKVFLHATSVRLAKEMRALDIRQNVLAIPFPIRPTRISNRVNRTPIKVVIAGTPRSGERQQSISRLLRDAESTFLRNGRCQMSMKSIPEASEPSFAASLPRTSREHYQRACTGDSSRQIEVVNPGLSASNYHRWISSADIAVFLHDPKRYQSTCNPVMLELMAHGVPVIVPDKCWFAEQLRAAGGHRSIGFIYQSQQEIPGLIRQYGRQRGELKRRAAENASTIVNRHSPTNVLANMGLKLESKPRRVA